MIAMQYKISLPKAYDMNIIRERVKNNGFKTDGFQGLLCKAYLMKDSDQKEYAPLYIWKETDGMNKFLFEGYYDNILMSFGWQNIAIGVPYQCILQKDFQQARYVIEIEHVIAPSSNMKALSPTTDFANCCGTILVYNPDKWKYVEYHFFKDHPNNIQNTNVYEILHISM